MSTDEPVVVIAHWQTTEASLNAVLDHVTVLGPQSLAEPGCLGYDVFRSVDDPTSLCSSSITATEPPSTHT